MSRQRDIGLFEYIIVAVVCALMAVVSIQSCETQAILERANDEQKSERMDRHGEEEANRPVENLREVPYPARGPATRGQSDDIQPRQGVQADPRRAKDRRVFNVSAYCGGSCCCQGFADGITASGKPVVANAGRFCAADRTIPFGTRIRIPGYAGGLAVPVLDRGGAITKGKLDVFFADDPGKPGSGHQKALNWGRQTLTCEVMKP